MGGPAVAIEIAGRCRGCEALDAGSDRNRDHVLLQPLVIADAGVAPRRQQVDEVVLGNDLEPDFGICGEEARHDRGQHQPRRADRDIEPQRARWPVAKAVHQSSAASTSVKAGPSRSSSRWPAAVGATLRVVRLSSLTPSCASSRRTASLSPDALAPFARAPSRKPPARATATKAFR